MTINGVFELRKQGRIEEAYNNIRLLYAKDKAPRTTAAMFWVAVDILKARACEGCIDEARKILLALERMLPNVPDNDGWVLNAFRKCRQALTVAEEREKMRTEGPYNIKMGIWGEDIAAAYLRNHGYVILERDWHSGHRDIDIIARYGEYFVFVEVKTRRNTDFGDPIDAIDYKKCRNIRMAMNHYINYKNIDNPIRFDIITIIGNPDCGNPVINHLDDVQIM